MHPLENGDLQSKKRNDKPCVRGEQCEVTWCLTVECKIGKGEMTLQKKVAVTKCSDINYCKKEFGLNLESHQELFPYR
jgi:hypothetical protein